MKTQKKLTYFLHENRDDGEIEEIIITDDTCDIINKIKYYFKHVKQIYEISTYIYYGTKTNDSDIVAEFYESYLNDPLIHDFDLIDSNTIDNKIDYLQFNNSVDYSIRNNI